jgi:hypothetical protein
MNERDKVIEAIDCIIDSVMCGCEPVEQRLTLLGIFDRATEMRDHYRQQREGLSSRADYWELRTRETKAELAAAEAKLAASERYAERLREAARNVIAWQWTDRPQADIDELARVLKQDAARAKQQGEKG